jgi:predicted transcriptional regulator of viral defense system
MPPPPPPPPSPGRAVVHQLHDVAAANHGVFTRADALALGLSGTTLARRVRAGYYERLAPGVFRVRGHPATWLSTLRAAVTVTGGLAARRTALALHGLPPTRRIGVPSIVVSHGSSTRSPVLARIHRSRTLEAIDATTVLGIPTCTVSRALVDHAAEVSAGAWRELVAEAVRTKLTTPGALRETLRRAGPAAGTSMARDVVARLDPDTTRSRSGAELRFIDLVEHAGLPRPVLNHEVVHDRGGMIAELDAAYVDRWLAFEIDGAPFHSLPGQLERDEMKDLRLRELGWDVRRIPARALTRNPHWVVARVRAALEQAEASYPARRASASRELPTSSEGQ